MDIVGFCYSGMEQIAIEEVKRLIGKKGIATEGAIIIDKCTEEDLHKLAYFTQSLFRIAAYVGQVPCKDGNFKLTDKTSFNFLKHKTFKVECISEIEDRIEMAAAVGEQILELVECKVDLKKPQCIVVCHISQEMMILGNDVSGYDLSRREYKVFSHKESVKGPISYALVAFSGFDGSQEILDPFCRGGDIVIEAAYIASGFPVRHFEKDKMAFIPRVFLEQMDVSIKKFKGKINGADGLFQNIQAGTKNAKIGGVGDSIEWCRVDLEWIDIKFKKGEIDLIVTMPPLPRQYLLKNVMKEYDTFWKQAKYLVSKSGTVTVIDNPLFREAATKAGWKMEKEVTIKKGQAVYNIVSYGRGK